MSVHSELLSDNSGLLQFGEHSVTTSGHAQLTYFTMLLIPLQSFHDPEKCECKMCKYPPKFYWLASLYRRQVSKQAGLDISSL